MADRISANAMRDQLLARLGAPSEKPSNNEWVRVLGIHGYRELLGLVARHGPNSIGELAQLASRAQPNVSRALSALVDAGLIEIVSNGRRSIPRITELGSAKVHELGLLKAVDDVGTTNPVQPKANLFSIQIIEPAMPEVSGDRADGILTHWLWLDSANDPAAARIECDLDALARHLMTNWWRMLYRRDAPFRLWDFTLDEYRAESFGLILQVFGSEIHLNARRASNRKLDIAQKSKLYSTHTFEQHLLEEFFRPLAAHTSWKGRSARPLHALLRRIEDSREQFAETAFCRTAGALGATPYDLSDDFAGQIRDLIGIIADEDARLDFSSAVLTDDLKEGRDWIKSQLDRFRQHNSLPALPSLRTACLGTNENSDRPYLHGYALARSAREYFGMAEDEPSGGIYRLSKLLGLEDEICLSPAAPGALRAFQSFEGDAPILIVEDEGPKPSLFTFARGVGDFVAFGNRVSCVTALHTDRQAVGRAFAAEFLAPRSAVLHMIEQDDQSISQIANYFGVSDRVIHHQYENSSR